MKCDDAGDALEAFQRYTEAFQTLNPQAVAPHFHQPALMITPQQVVVLPTTAAVERLYKQVMSELPGRGYARTEFSPLAEHRLSHDLAVVSGSGTWRTAAGVELQRFGMTYTWRQTPSGWRIVVAAIHDADVTE